MSEEMVRCAKYHAHLGVTAADVDLCGRAMVAALGSSLGDAFSEDAASEWTQAFARFAAIFGHKCDLLVADLQGKSRGAPRHTDTPSDFSGWLYLSQYESKKVPTPTVAEEHRRECFKKRWCELRGRHLYVSRGEAEETAVERIDLFDVEFADTIGRFARLPSPSPFSFGLWVSRSGGRRAPLYFIADGDNAVEDWTIRLRQHIMRFDTSPSAPPPSRPHLGPTLLGETYGAMVWRSCDFENLNLLGRGSFGDVYKVREFASGQIYACKVLQYSQAEGAAKEAQILLSLDHPFIVLLHGTFVEDERIHFVFEFLSGGELFHHMRKHAESRFSEAQALFYSSEVALALEHLRVLRIVHRDIKAENLVLDRSGHCILTDFGFAKQVDDSVPTVASCGTLAYMAPEIVQASIQRSPYGLEVDWWAFGVLIFTMLTGCYPFLKKEPRRTAEAICRAPLAFPPDPELSPEATEALHALLQKGPQDRAASLSSLKGLRWWAGYDWVGCRERKLPPPFVPDGSRKNTKYFKDSSRRPTGGGSRPKLQLDGAPAPLSVLNAVHQRYWCNARGWPTEWYTPGELMDSGALLSVICSATIAALRTQGPLADLVDEEDLMSEASTPPSLRFSLSPPATPGMTEDLTNICVPEVEVPLLTQGVSNTLPSATDAYVGYRQGNDQLARTIPTTKSSIAVDSAEAAVFAYDQGGSPRREGAAAGDQFQAAKRRSASDFAPARMFTLPLSGGGGETRAGFLVEDGTPVSPPQPFPAPCGNGAPCPKMTPKPPAQPPQGSRGPRTVVHPSAQTEPEG
eukprot:TRINITY_DN406_c0_g1_i1.p1 TRINITY_DN406_c0_g1~~TRINITY_DN406_c0_g1_i1.p1  ORF type:complete len:932 (+),score=240.75 TRINITY_DN406_c0_g1_i1:398-2797(+)